MQKKSVWRPPKVSLDQGRRSSVSRRSSASLDLDILQAAAEGGESEEARADRSCLRTSPRPWKKQGETISKGHRNYELMLNLQLGIRCLSVLHCCRHGHQEHRRLSARACFAAAPSPRWLARLHVLAPYSVGGFLQMYVGFKVK